MSATWEIRQGDALEQLREMPDESVQCCVTSPPYFGLRDYGVDGQLGLEATPDEYVARLVEVFCHVRRVLRSDGTLWLNLGDSFATRWSSRRDDGGRAGFGPGEDRARHHAPPSGYKTKDLIGVPWMVAFALRADGWWLRSDIIWAKPNPMPESVTDRPTSAHEHVFLLAKSARYFYDADAIREAGTGRTTSGNVGDRARNHQPGDRSAFGASFQWENDEGGRNRRNVWEVPTQPYPEAHFATFPLKLVEPCILAGSSPTACGGCGAPQERIVEVSGGTLGRSWHEHADDLGHGHKAGAAVREGLSTYRREMVGWRPTCMHSDDTGHSVVLDPFAGSGTTGVVALRLGRSFIGVELNPEYVELSRRRLVDDAPLLNAAAEACA